MPIHHFPVQTGKLSSKKPGEGQLAQGHEERKDWHSSLLTYPPGHPLWLGVGEQQRAMDEGLGVCRVWQKSVPLASPARQVPSAWGPSFTQAFGAAAPWWSLASFSNSRSLTALDWSREGTVGTTRIWGNEGSGKGKMVTESQKEIEVWPSPFYTPPPHTGRCWKEFLGGAQKPVSVGSRRTQCFSPTMVGCKWQQAFGIPAARAGAVSP